MRYLVMGGASHVGAAVAVQLAARTETERVVIADVTLPSTRAAGVDVAQVDGKDAREFGALLESWKPDVLMHLPAPSSPANGKKQDDHVMEVTSILAAAAAADTPRVVVVSSGAAYEHARGGQKVAETASIRSNVESPFAKDRATTDRLAQLWAARQPDRTMTIVRPCAVIGPVVDDDVSRAFVEPPFRARLADPSTAVQFLHEDDFVAALVLLASGAHGGAFNVAGDGTVTLGECLKMLGLKASALSRHVLAKLGGRGATTSEGLDQLSGTPPLATDRLRNATGWTPPLASRAAFEKAMGARGKLASI